MITRLRVKNYRCFEDFDWTPDQICLLIGQNGTGKSTLFGLLEGLRGMLLGERRVDAVFSFLAIPRNLVGTGVDKEIEIVLELKSNGKRFAYAFHRRKGSSSSEPEIEESLYDDGKAVVQSLNGKVRQISKLRSGQPDVEFQIQNHFSSLSVVGDLEGENSISSFLDGIRGIFTYRPNPKNFGFYSEVSKGSVLLPDGDNFSGWLYCVREAAPQAYAAFEAELHLYLPQFDHLAIELENDNAKVQVHLKGQKIGLSFWELSDGQKMLVALLAMTHLLVPTPGVLILDEPENFLALSEIQPLIHRLLDSAQENGRQLIIASHHPELFNELAKSFGVLLSRSENGTIGWKRFRDVEEYGLSPAEVIARGWELN